MADTGMGNGPNTNVFDEREKAFETQYRLEEEIAFKAEARAAHLFGLWVAERLGLAGAEAEAYSQTIREADLLRPNHLEMLRKATADLAAKGISITDPELQARRELFFEEAKKHLLGDLASGRQRLEPGF